MRHRMDCDSHLKSHRINEELQRIKDEIAYIDAMTESEQHQQRKTLDITIQSRMKFLW